MSLPGPERHLAAPQQSGRFWTKAALSRVYEYMAQTLAKIGQRAAAGRTL
jgi:hypothetical protein